MKKIVLSALVMVLSLTMTAIKPSLIFQRSISKNQQWVDSVYKTLSDRERVAQLFIPMVDPRSGASSKATIAKWVKTEKMGGLLFSKGSLADYATMTNYAQSIASVPVLMTFDGEWGLSMRIKETPRFPYNMGLGAISNEKLLYEYGREMARECREIGIHVNFAPVFDVNSNPSNPVIGYRSFGEDPTRVSRLGVAYSRGLEDGGVLSVSKHFPGHGDTSVDSHKALPTVSHDRTTLNMVDLLPFNQYVNAGLSGVMVGHLSVPALDKSGIPASLSKAITTDLLRDDMGFEGLIFTDALAMKGANSSLNNCVAALIAGADVLLGSNSPSKDLDAVMAAIKSGKITSKMIETRCKKVLAYKYALGLTVEKPVDMNGLEARINSSSADAVNRKLSAALMTVVRNDTKLLPIRGLSQRSIAVVNIGASSDDVFSRFCRKYANVKVYSSTGVFSSSTLASIKTHDVVIVGVFGHKSAHKQAFAQLKSIPNIVPVFFVNPYEMAEFGVSLSGLKTLVIAYDDTRYIREYAAQAIFGGIEVDGRLPVNLKGIAPLGTGVKLKKTRLGYTSPEAVGLKPNLEANIDELVNQGLQTKAFPGCQVLVAKDGNVIINKSYGTLDFVSKDKVTEETIYDLASVSKTTGTLPGVMKAYDEGLFELDAPVSQYIEPLQGGDKSKITVRQLLYHESGMPAAVNMFNMMMDTATYEGKLIQNTQSETYSVKIENGAYGHKDARLRRDITSSEPTNGFRIAAADGIYVGQATMDTIMSRIYNIKLRDTKKYNYSCLNFCLLMNMEEWVTGRPHNEWVDETIFAPLGAFHTGYRPLEKWDKSDIAPTEKDNFLRRQTVRGYVHDETANFSGGVQGNAGLFSNANDLAKLCQMWLNGGEYGGERLLSEKTVKLFTTSKSPTCRRGLGFDKPDKRNEKNSPTCREASAATYGHTGFTGTCFWVDPQSQLIYIFLCNRVNPTRNNSAFSRLNIRPRLFAEVYKAIK
ncbi:MAG: serine hydrolase [Muribaculaceae bacterium]|nr:serine hydrolase [Muribaculaceae bacterium]